MVTSNKQNNTKHITPDIKRRVSSKKKQANNFKRQRDIMDAFDYDTNGVHRDSRKIENYEMNWDLFNGRLDVTAYSDPICFNVGEEEVELKGHTITHYPLISQIASAWVGEIEARPFKPIAIDTGPSGMNFRSKKIQELLQRLAHAEVIAPIQQMVQQQYMQQNNVKDPFALSVEEQQQMMADIQSRTEKLTPKDIADFIANDLETPNQRILQDLSDHLSKRLRIEQKIWENGKNAVVTGEEIYYVGERYGEPVFETVNGKHFTSWGSQNVEWYQEKSGCRYEQWFTIEDIMQRHAEYLTNSDLKQLEKLVEPIGGFRHVGDPEYDGVQRKVMHEMSIGGEIARKYDGINYKTKEGSNQFKALYNDVIKKYGNEYGTHIWNYGIREAHICWRDKRKLHRVIRIENGRKTTYWRDEHYEPTANDYEVSEIWVDQVWEGTKIGSVAGEEFYLNIRPIPGQYKSIHNPFGTDLPYYGKPFNTHKNNSKNVSPVDLGKPWQMEFDIMMSNLKHDLATDLGKVLMIPMMLKPENWQWQDWLDTIKHGKLAITQLSRHGMTFDSNLLRNIDLSKVSDMVGKINMLNFIFQQLVRSMRFNDARIGAIGQYTTGENIAQSSNASYNQTESFFNTHLDIAERAVNALLNRTRILYKNRPEEEYIYDDISRILSRITPDFWFEVWGIHISLSSDDAKKVKEIQAQMQAFIQNGISFEGILGVALADNSADVKNVIRIEQKKAEQRRAEEMAQAERMNQERIASQERTKQAELQFDKYKLEATLASQEKRADIQADQFRRQADVDNNRIPDTVQKAMMDLQQKQEKLIAELEIAKEKLRIEEKEIDLKYGGGPDR